MEKKTRYCYFCGDKTNDSTCIICGKRTRPASMRVNEQELQLISDDLSDNLQDFHGDKGNQESLRNHAKKIDRLHMKVGEHPYFKQQITSKDQSTITRAVLFLAVLSVVVVFLFLILGRISHK